jgi:hypothetical protein
MQNDDTDLDDAELLKALVELRTQHRQLDVEINALRETGAVDMLKLGRMKKIKLQLKDKIAAIEDSLTPDIIA